MRSRFRLLPFHAFALMGLLQGSNTALAKTLESPRVSGHVFSNEQELASELRVLLRRVSFNIIRMDHGFSMSLDGEKIRFQALPPSGTADKSFQISGTRFNGIISLNIGTWHFHDVRFHEISGVRPMSGLELQLGSIRLR